MLVSYNWLKEYVDLSDIDAEVLGERMTLSALELDKIIERTIESSQLVVGEVKELEHIPDTHLNLTQVDAGEGSLRQIVCGAPNIALGQKVIVALPGAILPGDFEIGETTLQGYESKGMICSLQELGFPENVVPKQYVEGIFVLPEEVEVGEDVRNLIGLDDSILDFEITPNRGDALSYRGMGYEVSALLDQEPNFETVQVEESSDDVAAEQLSINVEDADDSPLYATRIIKNVTVQESPLWLQRKLMSAGMRPIDNLVDVTNYIMLEYGQPLHAYDADKISTNKIGVRRAHENETVVTLDEKERKLEPNDIVITDGEKTVGIGGVMGGISTAITNDSQNVILEAAIFNPTSIRRTAQRLNLRSEASSRFEKKVNPDSVIQALDHAAQLLAELGDGQVSKGIVQVDQLDRTPVEIETSIDYLSDIIGIKLNDVVVSDIFNRLGFEFTSDSEGNLTVKAPARRPDITIPADLAEEVARIYGYANITPTLPKTATTPGGLNMEQKILRQTSRYLENSGLNEAITYSLTTDERAVEYGMSQADTINLMWPMSEEHETLRQSIIPGLLEATAYNNARSQPNVFLYETGRIFLKDSENALPIEEEHVAGILTGSLNGVQWIEEEEQVDFYTAKGILDGLFDSYALSKSVHYEQATREGMHPGRTANIRLNGDIIGFIGQIHPTVAKTFDLTDVYVFEFKLIDILETPKASQVMSTVGKYPGITRDVALLVEDTVTNKEIVDVIVNNAGAWLRSVNLFDFYTGENIEDGYKSVAYSLYYENPDATLVEKDVQEDFERVLKALTNELNAEIR